MKLDLTAVKLQVRIAHGLYFYLMSPNLKFNHKCLFIFRRVYQIVGTRASSRLIALVMTNVALKPVHSKTRSDFRGLWNKIMHKDHRSVISSGCQGNDGSYLWEVIKQQYA